MSDESKRGRRIPMAVSPLLWVAALFGGAGRLDWARGWITLAMYLVGMSAIALAVRRYNAPLMKEREDWRRKDTKSFDKVFLAALLPLTFVQPLVAGIDAVRYRWTSMPLGLAYAGAVLLALSMALIAWTMAVNRHAETTVRIQTDRGHTVVDSGPYRTVRHPMYVGSIVMYVSTPLLLGSWWAMAVAAVMAGLFVWRAAVEDRTLRRELAGYENFTARTRYRLLPGLW